MLTKPHIEELTTNKSAECERILRALPEWFALEEPLLNYCREVAHLPVFVSKSSSDEVTGLLSLIHHNEFTSEIHVMGVLPEFHRTGIGHALVERAIIQAKSRGSRLLEVKTLGPSHPNPGGYINTLQFYRKIGFLPVEELHGLWAENPCLLLIKVLD
jgi:GNAT superfamily N-acetyltransferase